MAEPFFIRCTYLVTWIIFHLKKRCSYYKTDTDWGALKDFEQEDSLLVKAGRMGGGGPGRRRGSESLEVQAGVGLECECRAEGWGRDRLAERDGWVTDQVWRLHGDWDPGPFWLPPSPAILSLQTTLLFAVNKIQTSAVWPCSP